MQQRLHGAVLGHRHRESRRAEAGLAHPAGHHGAAELAIAAALAGGQHAEGAHHAAQGLHRRVAAALGEAAAGAAPLLAPLLHLQAAAEGGARFLAGFEGGGIGAELHLDRLEGEAEATIPQLAFQQVEGLAAPAEAAEHPHRFGPVAFRQQAAQGRHDRRGGMAPQGGGADQHRITTADRLEQRFRWGELAVDALHAHAGAGHPLGQGIGDGGRVAVGAGEQQRHRQLGPLLRCPPAAVVAEQAAPAFADGGAMAGGDGADRQLVHAVEHHLHLPRHRRHQAVVEVAAVLLGAAAVGLRPGGAAEVGGEELAAHQQAGALLKGHQCPRPAGGGGGVEAEPQAMGQGPAALLLHHIDRRQLRQLRRCGVGVGASGPLLAPEVLQQARPGVGGHQHQCRPVGGQAPQQGDPVGVHVAHDHLQGGIGGHQGRQLLQERRGEGVARRVHQHRRDRLAGGAGAAFKQEAVGAGAALQAVFHLEAQAPRAEAPQADQTRLQRNLDDTAVCAVGLLAGGHQ